MRGSVFGLAMAIVVAVLPVVAKAGVEVEIDVGSQTMEVYVEGQLRHTWRVSTGRRGHATPGGSYSAKRLERRWYSQRYDGSPMPHAIFFRGGYAIHGTGDTQRLGRPASHGCVRLAPGNAAQLYNLVERYGRGRTRISINH